MAKIQAIRKLIVEDFGAESRDLVMKLASVLNPFLDQVNTALSQKITYSDNLKAQVYNISLAEGISTIVMPWNFNEKPIAVYIGNLTKSNGEAPSSVFSMSSTHSDKRLTLNFLGLDTATAHNAIVIAQI